MLYDVRNVKNNGHRPVLMVDELDKIGYVTEHKLSAVHTLIDSVYSEGGQIIATCNLSRSYMQAKLGQVGEAILRRITNDGDMAYAVYFEHNSVTIFQNGKDVTAEKLGVQAKKSAYAPIAFRVPAPEKAQTSAGPIRWR